jgi:hypothetical protein
MTHTDEAHVPLFRFYDSDAVRVDPDIADALEREFEYTMGPGFSFEFNMKEKDFYSVLSVIDSWNAPVLIEMGMTTPESVTLFLIRHGMNHLIRDNHPLAATAERLKVPVGIFINIYSAAHSRDNAYANVLKGVEKYAELKGKRYCQKTLLPLMVCGAVNYEDAEVIGYEAIEENSNIPEVVSSLVSMKRADDKHVLFPLTERNTGLEFSALDIRRALDGTQPFRASRVKLLMTYGPDVTFAINNPVHVSQICFREKTAGRDELSGSLVVFIDAIITETARVAQEASVTVPELPPISVLKRMHGAGVDPVFASPHFVGDEWDENHIMALHNGVTQPLTSGWL